MSKPLLRGHFHQAAFFISLGACAMLLNQVQSSIQFLSFLVYSCGLLGMFGISALYHRPHWEPGPRLWMRRLDHAAIYVMVGGTSVPLCLVGFPDSGGIQLLKLVWSAVALGLLQSLVWVNAPKALSAILYIIVGCLSLPFVGGISEKVGQLNVVLLCIGGAFYIAGGVIYAVRKPNPWPLHFGYHELFHLFVIFGALAHFLMNLRILNASLGLSHLL